MTDWRNRIVGEGLEDPEQLLANPFNARIHPKFQQDSLESVLDEIGWVQRVIVNRTTSHVIDGHLRVALAITRGEQVPVDYVELTESEEKTILATFDYITSLANYDNDLLTDLLQDVNTDNAALQALLDDMAQQNGIDLLEETPLEDAGPQIDKGAELAAQYGTSLGQVWQLGRHRLACIDSTDVSQVKSFLQGVDIDAVFADPPYGVDVVQSGKVGAVFKKSVATKGNYSPVIGDASTDTAINAYHLYCTFAPVQIWWGANYYAHALPASSCWVVWDKRAGTEIKNTFADCELAWTNHTGAARIYRQLWNGMIREGEHEKRVHPTQKPVELAKWCFEEFTDTGDVIADPFAGSGISIIAGEQAGRVVYAMEMSPSYTAVIINRWEVLTGEKAVLIDDASR